MIRTLGLLLLRVLLLLLSSSGLMAQERAITRLEFLGMMRMSEDLTKSSPYRYSVTIEIGAGPNGPWEPYSSWLDERVLPDRSHLIYTSRIRGEVIRVGKVIYRKEVNGSWVRHPDEAKGWVVNPASAPGFNGPIVEYWSIPFEDDGATVKVISRPQEKSAKFDEEIYTYFYHFDQNELLYKKRSTSFNGTNWVHRVERIDYDPNIIIEAPIK